nr:immunoglobulin heavy chain junction region [Macaca mulatta]MOX58882.1 immunoglobulin heavy chain junction region [Macaca mulatta]MOX58931.1 immunoglobulin heavy chain junction region [Macaca mulatta]MOX58940.1 immunoglobulin heavy chain junction region [Macaca mulatta]MOX58965.1 immunoglobulin heavy chain junction region [Macaca mulatta]
CVRGMDNYHFSNTDFDYW